MSCLAIMGNSCECSDGDWAAKWAGMLCLECFCQASEQSRAFMQE